MAPVNTVTQEQVDLMRAQHVADRQWLETPANTPVEALLKLTKHVEQERRGNTRDALLQSLVLIAPLVYATHINEAA